MKRIGSLMILVAALVALGSPTTRTVLGAPAVIVFNVTSTADDIDDNPGDSDCHTDPLGPAAGLCTLRAAVQEANRTSNAGGAMIMLPAGVYTLTISPSGGPGDSWGDLNLTTPSIDSQVISIVGAGADNTIIDANQLDRAFSIESGRTATISGVTIRNGYVTFYQNGGGIHNLGNLTISDSTVTGNQGFYGGGIWDRSRLTVLNSVISQNISVNNGGGIYSNGDLNVRNTTISGNQGGNYGGGIATYLGLTMRNSTVSGNHAIDGGGILNEGTMTAMNSTISQNTADINGGGIFNQVGTAGVYNATIVFNQARANGISSGTGGGVFNADSSGAVFKVRNSIVAGNATSTSPFQYYDDCAGTLNSYGANLFKAVLVSSSCVINTVSNGWSYINSLNTLGPLQNNGGPTQTHALLSGSNAIDAGIQCVDYNLNPLPTDQRGFARIVDGTSLGSAICDVGAFEYQRPLFLPLIMR